jgi:DNA polymerase type B, organellar and viral
MSKVNNNQHVYFIFRIKFTNNQIATISTLKKINKNSKEELIEYLLSRLSLSNEAYNVNPVFSIIFSYGIREGEIVSDLIAPIKVTKYQIYYNNKLPIAILPEEYGKILSKKGNHYVISVGSANNSIIILDSTIKNKKRVNIIQFIKKGKVIYNWVDKIIDDNSFIREIGKSTYHYINKELILVKVIKQTKAISKTKVNNNRNTKIITMDLETILINNTHIPYLLSWYDGKISKSYFIESLYSNSLDLEKTILNMVNEAMNDICIRKYKNYRVYLHNFSKFDGYFLVKYLSKLGYCDPVIHKGRIISLIFLKYNSNYNITFRDSYLLLPSSLRKLAFSFNVESKKGIFPYLLANYGINYAGLVPDFKYFSNLSKDEYNIYKKSFIDKGKIWDFKIESQKYCELDTISLYQVLTKFNKLIFDKFSLNINNYPTLPSLSFAIFRTHYLQDKNAIHMLSGDISKNIRSSYTGGSVDMYIPKPLLDKKVYAYDVNSLYPYVMSKFKMPIGNPTFFEGNILNKYFGFTQQGVALQEGGDDKPFGFFFCKIIAPINLKYPIIQTHINSKDGTRTVSPLGTWSDMLFSEEIYNAMKFGYKFEVKWGYTFDSGFVFNDFVNDLYKLRLEYPKSDPMNYIAKIILNSLYGRFGMDDDFIFSYILNSKDYLKFESKNKEYLLDVIELGDNFLVQLKKPDAELDTLLDNGSEKHNVNISIASAITAYARIHMSQFKNNKDYNLYYSDTDSIYIDKPLNDSFISNTELGKLKLEKICKYSVFLAPKVYGIRDELGNEIIKVKGLSSESVSTINIDSLEQLLLKDETTEFNQNKWFRSISNGNITVKDQIYTLKVTGNKRKLIYENNKLIYLKYIAYHFTDNVKVVVINKI